MDMNERTKFKGRVSSDFKEGMIAFWMESESVDRETALGYYAGKEFDTLVSTLSTGENFGFTMDCGSGVENINKDSETDCFADFDNNFVIPVALIEVSGHE